ncbi:hypothetical protein GCM10028801_31190 [Nocardioides maradonensis]
MSENKAPMIGSRRHTGPGGRDCACCNEAPGRNRKRDKRVGKHQERQAWRRRMTKEQE